jgi:hypothetical protein
LDLEKLITTVRSFVEAETSGSEPLD